MLTIRALSGGETYASRHLSSNDYYSEQEKVIGVWIGQGAELLGLEGEVQMEQFDAIRQGIHPVSGQFLRPRHSADRFNDEGERTGMARSLYDFTVSAPKSVSIQATLDPRLAEAHEEAVREMAREMESLAAARVRRNGANGDRTTGNVVIAQYRHDSSRELDPQIHTHLVAANLTYDGVESRWKALEASAIYNQRAYLTEVYRNALARSVRGYGYEVVNRFDESGRERGFELQGISPETLAKFSQRSEQRDTAIAGFVEENGRLPTNGEIAVLVRETRSDKLAEISSPEVKAQQRARFAPGELARIEDLYQAAQQRGPIREQTAAAVSLQFAREHIFERVSVAPEHELKTEALRHGRGTVALEDLRTATALLVMHGTVLKAGTEVATAASLERERAMIAAIHRGQGRYRRLGGSNEFVVSDRLRPEQKLAVQTVLDSRDLAVNLRGAAGTGKTTTLQEIRRGVEEGGRGIVAVAPTRSAVQELEKVGFGQALTIERLLLDEREQGRLTGQVLLIDEAGMVSARQMAALIQVAERRSAQILFSGDTRQIQSVEAGDALRVLEQESRLHSVSLRQVQRQSLTAYRKAVEELRQDPARGWARIEAMGALREVDWQLRPQEVSKAYREALATPNAKGFAREVLIVAPTHEEIRRVTETIRRDRQRAGEVGEDRILTRHVPLNWTQAQKQDMKRYRAGMVLEFHKATRQVRKNEAVEVVAVSGDKLIVRKQAGKETALTRRQAQAFSVFERKTIEVAAGDKLMLQANRREKGFRSTNGELVTVQAVGQDQIQLEDGRTLPANYQQFDHGYAITAHRSQGKTVDAVIVSGDRMSRELFYVAATRGRESLTVITSDKEQFAQSIGISGERQSATELARKAGAEQRAQRLPEFTIKRGLESAKLWALRLALQLREQVLPRTQAQEQEIMVQQQSQHRQEHKKREKGIDHGIGR